MLDISAGGRPVNAVGASMDENGRLKPVILDTTNSPNTVVPFVFEDPQYLMVDPSGHLYLGINIGLDIVAGESLEATRERDKDYPWFVRDVDIILEGKTLSQP